MNEVDRKLSVRESENRNNISSGFNFNDEVGIHNLSDKNYKRYKDHKSFNTQLQKTPQNVNECVNPLTKLYKKTQSLSDPTTSPAQSKTKTRRTLVENSPYRKRSKSESRRRREKKCIAVGEFEVQQANESLMRYLRQCTEINDASLSGELEIDNSYEERKVHRKTKTQRERRCFQNVPNSTMRNGQNDGLKTMLDHLVDDIIPNSSEIYNPFTPVISPTEIGTLGVNSMFVQTANGYSSVSNNAYKTGVESHARELR